MLREGTLQLHNVASLSLLQWTIYTGSSHDKHAKEYSMNRIYQDQNDAIFPSFEHNFRL